MDYLITLILLALSALFSGLTLGYFTLDKTQLRRQAKLGDHEAVAILPIRDKGNQLLTTLLLGNVATNAVLSIFLSSLVSGVLAGVIATILILVFGEIIPQSALSRHGKRFGALAAPYIKIVMWMSSPITLPIAYTLDKLLGHEVPTVYSKEELKELVTEHQFSEHSPIDADEERIVHGALQFSHTVVRDVMTPKDNVVSFDINQRLSHDFYHTVNNHGYSRYPIYNGQRDNIVGVLFAKDLIIEDDDITIGDTTEAYEENILTVRPEEYLDIVLARMLKKQKHLGIVRNRNQQFLGVISLEDIIEEIIQVEIEDEDDVDE